MSNTPTQLNKTDARQGRRGLRVSKILAWGMILVIVAFVILFIVLSKMPVSQ